MQQRLLAQRRLDLLVKAGIIDSQSSVLGKSQGEPRGILPIEPCYDMIEHQQANGAIVDRQWHAEPGTDILAIFDFHPVVRLERVGDDDGGTPAQDL